MTELWLAVINRALLDAAMPVPELKPGTSTARKWEILRAARLRDEAREWLLEPNPDFDLVCEMAGVQPWKVREYAAARLLRIGSRILGGEPSECRRTRAAPTLLCALAPPTQR